MTANGPLHGVRVLDLTAIVAGPVASMMLADQGADVIKIEPPSGDLARQFGVKHEGESAFFHSCNRSKRSLCVDLKKHAGVELVKKLVATADVLVQNFRPGAITRMGLGEDVVREIKPDIIFVSMSGFGDSGPYSHQRVYDPIIQAVSGLADIQRDQETGQPKMIRTVIPDKTTAVTSAQAITAALFHRERTGEGQHVKLAMLDVMIGYLWPEGSSSLTFVGHESDPTEGQLGLDLVFETQDGHISAAGVSDAEWKGLCRAFDRSDLLDDPRFASSALRSKNIVIRRAIMAEEIAKWPSSEILARLNENDVPSGPILTRTELLDDPQVVHNEVIVDTPTENGLVRQPRPAARFSASPARISRVAPRLGAHNDEIAAELGYDEGAIAALRTAGALAGEA
ncbi:MAG: CoA transferase [Pseudomonadota bacterium]